MNARLHVALPAALTFVFGVGFGLVVSRVAWSGRQAVPRADGMPSAATPTTGGASPHDGDGLDDPQILRKSLAQHEALLVASPEDIGLLRAVGNYRSMLGENDEALEIYARAEALARTKGDITQLVNILTDAGVALAEKGQYAEGLAKLDQAKATEPQDTRSRLTAALILLTRIMPAPPPGWDRKQAGERAEALLREVLVIEPGESNATEMLGMIASIRGSMARGNMPHPGALPAERADAGGAAASTTSTGHGSGTR